MRFTSIAILALALPAAVVVDAQPFGNFGDSNIVCEDDQSTLVITLLTDNYPRETSWTLKKKGNGLRDWETIAEKERRSFRFKFTEYSDAFCIDSGDTYLFNIKDSYGDGLCVPGQENCGSYTVTLDGHDIAVGTRFGDEANVVATGGDCVDGVGEFQFIQSNESGKLATVSCGDVVDRLEVSPGLAEKGCRLEGHVGGELLDYCAGTCGAYGYGRRGRCCDPCVETEAPTTHPTSNPASTYSPTTTLYPTTIYPTTSFPTTTPTSSEN